MIYDLHFGTYFDADFFQITCCKESKNMVVEKHLRGNDNFLLKKCCLVITRNKKYLLKQVVPTTCAPEKMFFAPAILLKICELFLFRQTSRYSCIYIYILKRIYLGLYEFFWGIPANKRPNKYCSEALAQGYSVKSVFLEISHNSQESTCARVSSVNLSKRDSGIGLFLWILQNFREHLF